LAAEATGRVDTIPRLVPHYQLERNLLPALAARSDLFPPGFRQTRSAGATDLLALLLERTQKRPWRQVLAAEALKPLGMRGSAFLTPAQAEAVPCFFRDGARCDPRILESLVPPLSPALSLRSSLADLAAAGTSLLAACAGQPGPLSPRVARTVLAPAIPGQLDRQGYASGLGWNLTDYRLGYLGRVAWTYGTSVTHQTLIILLPDLGLGVVLAEIRSDPTGLFQFKHIARDLLQTYAELELGRPRPAFHVPSVLRTIPEGQRPLPGLYAAPAGVAEVGFQGDLLTVSARGGYSEFTWAGAGRFQPVADNEFAALEWSGDRLSVIWRSGARVSLAKAEPAALPLALEETALPVEARGSIQRRGTGLIRQREGAWVITADDGQSYLLLPAAADVRILCDEGSALFGCRITADPAGALHLLGP
jgi:CubicO group peptidase (beta-lactamase class C family)